ncbi:MAG: TRIC cation channel family protein [bacterium]|nr:TRIC cation channel family protein [bacterium]
MTSADVIYGFDLFGTFFFAVSGAFRAVKYELDLLGVVVLATAVGVGGGIMRDAMLGIHPPAALAGNVYLVVCIAAGLAVFAFAPRIAARWDMVKLADAVGLGVFAAAYPLGPMRTLAKLQGGAGFDREPGGGRGGGSTAADDAGLRAV